VFVSFRVESSSQVFIQQTEHVMPVAPPVAGPALPVAPAPIPAAAASLQASVSRIINSPEQQELDRMSGRLFALANNNKRGPRAHVDGLSDWVTISPGPAKSSVLSRAKKVQLVAVPDIQEPS
jgi:hypothetical protein